MSTQRQYSQAKRFGMFPAELAVDNFLPPAAYYLRPIDEESLETKKWLVRRSRRALVGGLAEPSREGKRGSSPSRVGKFSMILDWRQCASEDL